MTNEATNSTTDTNARPQEKDWSERAREIGQSAYDSIAEMVANLEQARKIEAGTFDWEDEAESLGFVHIEAEDEDGADVWAKDDKTWEDPEAACRSVQEYPDEDGAHQLIEEDPLSIQVRSGWTTIGDPLEAEEFELLLSTGGPAVRIVGEIRSGEAHRPRLEVQDRFKRWTEFFGADREVLETYCSVAAGYLGDC